MGRAAASAIRSAGRPPATRAAATTAAPRVSLTQGALTLAAFGVGLYLLFIAVLLVRGRRPDARALAGFIPDCIVLLRRLLADERVSGRRRLLLLGLIGYLAMPFDLVPDFIPVAGQLDDAILVALVLRIVLRGAGPGVMREHWPGPAASLNLMLRLAGDVAPCEVRPSRDRTV